MNTPKTENSSFGALLLGGSDSEEPRSGRRERCASRRSLSTISTRNASMETDRTLWITTDILRLRGGNGSDDESKDNIVTEDSGTSHYENIDQLLPLTDMKSTDNLNLDSEETKFDISENTIINVQDKLNFIKEFFQDDRYWPKNSLSKNHDTINNRNRGKMIQTLGSVSNKLLFLDKCNNKPVINQHDLTSVINIINNATTDLEKLSVVGLSDRNVTIYEKTLDIKNSLENALMNLNDMRAFQSDDEQMRILRSPVNSPTGQQITYTRVDSHSSLVSVIPDTNLESNDLQGQAGPSGAQKRLQPEPDNSIDGNDDDDIIEIQKKTKTDDKEPEEHMGELNHLVHAELVYLKSIIDNDALAKRITIAMRKELYGSYNRICSVVRDITYQHAKLEGAYEQVLKDNKQKDMPIRQQTNNLSEIEGSYANALRKRKTTDTEPSRVSVHDGRLGNKKPAKQSKAKVNQPKNKPASVQAHTLVTDDARPNVVKTPSGGTFQTVGRKNKLKKKVKSIIDLTTVRKSSEFPRFVLNDSSNTEEYPKLWKSFWGTLRGRLKNPRLVVHRSRTKGPTILVPDDKATLDAIRDIEMVTEIIPKRPRLMLKGLDSSLTDTEVIRELIEYNTDLGLTDTDKQSIRVAYHSGPRNDIVSDLVLEVSPEILRRIEGKKVYIGGIRSTLSLNHSVSQCFKCQKYGHTAKNCRVEQPICRNCAESHDSRTCPTKDKFKCFNCKGNHKASSDNCPTKAAALKRLAKRTDYGQPPKIRTTEDGPSTSA